MESSRPPPPAAATAAPPAVQSTTPSEDETLKRNNTDCFYFLTSPLTCKKGSECEFRHSESARANPRECFYWLNSTCTNPKCGFRHPPLDGIFSVIPPPVPLPPPAAGYNATKQSTPCYYFQKGNCVKGDRCLFMHAPQSSGATNTVPQQQQQPPKPSATKEPWNPSSVAKTEQQQQSYNANNIKSAQENLVPTLPNATKLTVNFNNVHNGGVASATTKPRAVSTANNNNNNNNTRQQRPTKTSLAVGSLDEDRIKYPHNLSRGTQLQNRDVSDERPQDSREGDEFLGESSPGFDVIVDHDEEGAYATADSYNASDMYPIEDYESMSRYEREHEYEPEFGYKGNNNDQYDRKRRRREDSSSDRALDRPIRRHSHREEAGGIGAETGINGSDLRLRLINKQRKVNGSRSRSDVSPEKRHRREERHSDEWERYGNRGTDRTDRGNVHGRSRLEGRIKMPLRSSAEIIRSDYMHEDMEMEQRRRHLRGVSRVSPGDISSRRLHDRMGPRSDGRSELGGRIGSRRDEGGFSGPKSLAELKGVKSSERERVLSEGGAKESGVDFEGPKPLSEILKKKKKIVAAGMGSGNEESSENKSHNDDSSPKENLNLLDEELEEGMISEGNDNGTDHEAVRVVAAATGDDDDDDDDDDEKADEGEDQEMMMEEEPPYEGSNYYEGEDDENDENNAYQEEGEANEYREGEEDFEDDDEQDFARKIGVVLS